MSNGYVNDFLDNDLYKFTMQNAVCKLYPDKVVRYEFFNRDNRSFPNGFADELKRIVETFRGIKLTKEEKKFLRQKCYYLNPFYLDFLDGYEYDPSEVIIEQVGSELKIHIEGYWYRTILWEVPLMATISQLYFEKTAGTQKSAEDLRLYNKRKAKELNKLDVVITDFGTRRRFSYNNHFNVVRDFIEHGNFLFGSSNLSIAKEFDILPIGTQAHEWTQFHAARFGFQWANRMAMKNWVDVYKGNLGIALPDTFTTNNFLNSFDSLYARIFDGVRQDSGDPIEFARKIISKYHNLSIDSQTKQIVFSDNLKSVSQISVIHKACNGFINDFYGVGTWFTNDVGAKPLNIVIKLTECVVDGLWVKSVKLSDDPNKNTGDIETIKLCKQILKIF